MRNAWGPDSIWRACSEGCWGAAAGVELSKNSWFALGFGIEVVEASIIQTFSSTKKTSTSVISLNSGLVPSSLLCISSRSPSA